LAQATDAAPASQAAAGTESHAAPTPGEARYFELTDEKSNKFWEIRIEGARLLTRYGKLGSAGQTTLKELASEAVATAERDKLIAEKRRKGYLERASG
jgi:DNA ligase-1